MITLCPHFPRFFTGVQGWVDAQFADHIPNGEMIAAGGHAPIFDRSVTRSGVSVCVVQAAVALLRLPAIAILCLAATR